MSKKIFIILILVGLLNISCQSQKSDKAKQINQKSAMVDLLKINFKNDLNTLLSYTNFTSAESEFSEYLNAFTTKEVDSFKMGKSLFSSKYKVNDFEISNDSYISFVTKNENEEIIVVHIRTNYLGDEKKNYTYLKNMYGEPELLSVENSINDLKGRRNYVWKNFKNDYSILLSQISEGNIVPVNGEPSTKANSDLIYIVNNYALIDYPNGQKEEILERLIKRFSE